MRGLFIFAKKLSEMAKRIIPYKNSALGKKQQVTKMFNNLSKNYDRLNRIISFGIDIKWRNKMVAILIKKKPEIILDIATGTGDLAISLSKTKARKIIGLDISSNMLTVGKDKIHKRKLSNVIDLVLGDAENLNFKENSFDAVTVSFGVRNFENLEKGLSEIYRVLKTNGTLVVLETSIPSKTPWKQGYHFYTKNILPRIGKLFSKEYYSAYKYLTESANIFPYGEDFNNILSKIGFSRVEHLPQTLGITTIYIAVKT